jgi:hypothetical protein
VLAETLIKGGVSRFHHHPSSTSHHTNNAKAIAR